MSELLMDVVKCDLCDKMCKSHKGLLQHISKSHKDVQATECVYCKQKFSRSTYLPLHLSKCKQKIVETYKAENERLTKDNEWLTKYNEWLKIQLTQAATASSIPTQNFIASNNTLYANIFNFGSDYEMKSLNNDFLQECVIRAIQDGTIINNPTELTIVMFHDTKQHSDFTSNMSNSESSLKKRDPTQKNTM
jgi:hypothetical protein